MDAPVFHESNLTDTPIRDLGLKIQGTRLEPLLQAFEAELATLGLPVRPRFYLSTEWGVPWGTVAIAIPFYLARPELTRFHAERTSHVEGFSRADILRYLRHEMGHVVNYAWRLHDTPEWVAEFGPITRPYLEDYRPIPLSPNHVRHLPGWYAQKHPDEDWAETWAVWSTPGLDWRAEYAGWPVALRKLEYCDRTVAALRERPPLVTAEDLDEDVGEIPYTVTEYYRATVDPEDFPPGLDIALAAVFEPGDVHDDTEWCQGALLIRELTPDLVPLIYRFTGHFPERTTSLLAALAIRAEHRAFAFPADEKQQTVVGLTALVTTLAMSFVSRGSYFA